MLYLWQEYASEWIEYFKLDLTKGPVTLTQHAYTIIDLYSIDMHYSYLWLDLGKQTKMSHVIKINRILKLKHL